MLQEIELAQNFRFKDFKTKPEEFPILKNICAELFRAATGFDPKKDRIEVPVEYWNDANALANFAIRKMEQTNANDNAKNDLLQILLGNSPQKIIERLYKNAISKEYDPWTMLAEVDQFLSNPSPSTLLAMFG